ncbi:MAG TPA: hypothetical protein VFU14_20230 [Acidimicrobiales bacterium]|nr:hypothetical protein [Acidimicrobiales bacterium]
MRTFRARPTQLKLEVDPRNADSVTLHWGHAVDADDHDDGALDGVTVTASWGSLSTPVDLDVGVVGDDITVAWTAEQAAALPSSATWALAFDGKVVLTGAVEESPNGVPSPSGQVSVTVGEYVVAVEATPPGLSSSFVTSVLDDVGAYKAGGTDVPVADGGTGASTPAGARTNLELGNAATRNVGTAAGTVAAGDDARLSDARTPTDASVTAAKLAADVVALIAAKATPADITAAVDALVSAAPGALDTLNELAAALGDDPSFATTVTNALAAKVASADVGVASGVAATDADGDVVRPSDGAKIQPYHLGDLLLAVGERDGGTIEGGVIRRATSILVEQSGTQTSPPTDPAVGSALVVVFDVTGNDNAALIGSQLTSGFFGPRATGLNVEGRYKQGHDTTEFGLLPPAVVNALKMGNVPGDDVTITPAWGYINAPLFLADDGTVTTGPPDFHDGPASFVDSQVWLTADGGSLLVDVPVYSFLTGCYALGGAVLDRVVGYGVKEPNTYRAAPMEDMPGLLMLQPVGEGLAIDDAIGEVKENVGISIPHMTVGTVSNVGIENGSATVEVPLAVEIDAAGDTIPLTASTLHLDNTTGGSVVLTATPAIPAGIDGQKITLLNVSADSVIFPTTAGVQRRVRLGEGDAVTLTYSDALGVWSTPAPLPGVLQTLANIATVERNNVAGPVSILSSTVTVPDINFGDSIHVSLQADWTSNNVTVADTGDLTVELLIDGTAWATMTAENVPRSATKRALLFDFDVTVGLAFGFEAMSFAGVGYLGGITNSDAPRATWARKSGALGTWSDGLTFDVRVTQTQADGVTAHSDGRFVVSRTRSVSDA